MQETGSGKERHPSLPRMLDRTLVEEQAQHQAADTCGFLNSIIARGKNFLYTSPQGKTKGGGRSQCPENARRGTEEKSNPGNDSLENDEADHQLRCSRRVSNQ